MKKIYGVKENFGYFLGFGSIEKLEDLKNADFEGMNAIISVPEGLDVNEIRWNLINNCRTFLDQDRIEHHFTKLDSIAKVSTSSGEHWMQISNASTVWPDGGFIERKMDVAGRPKKKTHSPSLS